MKTALFTFASEECFIYFKWLICGLISALTLCYTRALGKELEKEQPNLSHQTALNLL